ncbi:MAG: hypothetical protein KKH01_08455 [Firmicutes bacterium]|nr:hypothetical protein [Bacillota bacterium]
MKEKKVKEPKQPKENKVEEKMGKDKIIDVDSEPVEEAKVKVPKEKKAKRPKNREKLTAKYFKKVSGKSIDSFNEMVQADYAKAIERAQQLSSIEKSEYSSPILITVPDAFHYGGKVNYRLDKKPDDTFTLMYDQALVYVLFFGKNSLFYYQANMNHINGQIASDIAGEFNYADVVHMETELKYDHIDRPKYITLDLEIGLVDGTIVPFHLRNHRVHQDYDLPSLLTQQEQLILGILKKKVRESRNI